jgi:hypothetical protein
MPGVETQTNQLYRKKYFIDAETIISGADEVDDASFQTVTPVIDASRVILSQEPVIIRRGAARETDRIHVDVVKEGPLVKMIRIACPCGRRTELDVQYESPS